MKTKPRNLLAAGLLVLGCGSGFASGGDATEGYRALAPTAEGFVAAGTDGRLDRLDRSGRFVDGGSFPGVEFNCLLSHGTTLFAAGNDGVLMVAAGEGAFKSVDSGTTLDIRSLTWFEDYLVAGAAGGRVLIGDAAGFFEQTTPAIKGNIVSLSAAGEVCWGVTDRGEIFHSRDLVAWRVFDFNTIYADYYEPCSWSAVVATGEQVAVAGRSADGVPALYLSTGGEVWSPRDLDYTDTRGIPARLSAIPRAMIHDSAGDRLVLACDGGEVMSVPSCSHCNEMLFSGIKQHLTAIAMQSGVIVVAGDGFHTGTVSTR